MGVSEAHGEGLCGDLDAGKCDQLDGAGYEGHWEDDVDREAIYGEEAQWHSDDMCATAAIEAMCGFTTRHFTNLGKEQFVKHIKNICEAVGFPVTVTGSQYTDESIMYPKNLYLVCPRGTSPGARTSICPFYVIVTGYLVTGAGKERVW